MNSLREECITPDIIKVHAQLFICCDAEVSFLIMKILGARISLNVTI